MSTPLFVHRDNDDNASARSGTQNGHLRSSWGGGAKPRGLEEGATGFSDGGGGGGKGSLLALTSVLDSDGYSNYYVDDYVLSVFAFGLLAFVGLALLWPVVHTRRKFASLKRKYKSCGRPVLGVVLEDDDIVAVEQEWPDVAAAMMMHPPQGADGCVDVCGCLRRSFFCCRHCSTRGGNGSANANARVVVQYESDNCRMIKPFHVTQSTAVAASENGTMPLVVLPAEDKSAIPDFFLRTRSPFGWGRYVLWGMAGIPFLAWSAYFAAEAVVGGTEVLTRVWNWGEYLSWAVLGVTVIVVVNLSNLLCRYLTEREYEDYVDGGAVCYPLGRSKSRSSQSLSQSALSPIWSNVEEQAPPRQRREQQQRQHEEHHQEQFHQEEEPDNTTHSTFEVRAVDGSHGRQGNDDDVTEVVYELVHVHKRS